MKRRRKMLAVHQGVGIGLFALQIVHRKEELLGRLQRLGPEGDPAEFTRLNSELMELEARRRALRADD